MEVFSDLKSILYSYLETGAKKSELVFQAITVIKNGIRAFWRFTKLFIMKNPFRKGKACFCSSTGS